MFILPETEDYFMQLDGVDAELKYAVKNKHTDVIEVRTARFHIAFDEMLSYQVAWDDIYEMIEVGVEFTAYDDDDDGGVVH